MTLAAMFSKDRADTIFEKLQVGVRKLTLLSSNARAENQQQDSN